MQNSTSERIMQLRVYYVSSKQMGSVLILFLDKYYMKSNIFWLMISKRPNGFGPITIISRDHLSTILTLERIDEID